MAEDQSEPVNLPDFQSIDGYPHDILPPGVYPCSEDEFQLVFIDRFPDSDTREDLATGFTDWREDAEEFEIASCQWVDGSFVETKENPNDIDVMSWVHYDDLNSLPKQQEDEIMRHLDGRNRTRSSYGVHSFAFPFAPTDHNFRETFEEQWRYWRKWYFGRIYNKQQPESNPNERHEKGILEMTLGDPDEVPPVPRQLEDTTSA